MLRRTLTLLRNELTKTLRTRFLWASVAAVGFVCVVMFLTIRRDDIGEINGWVYVGLVMQGVFAEVGSILIAAFSAMLMAEETATGTIRTALTAPIRRRELYLAKAGSGLLYMILVSAFALLLSLALAGLKYTFGPISDSAGVIYSTSEVVRNLVWAYALSWIPLGTLVLFGLCMSALTTRSGPAISLTVGSIILVESLKHFVEIGPFLFTQYIGAPWVVFHEVAQGVDYQWLPGMWRVGAVCGVYSVACFCLGLWRFCRRDMNL
ncbi:MAG: ABC transporter permease [Lentisphaerae bacterium]|nr:ABC transporter permease [Lentisphaerota bacterium]